MTGSSLKISEAASIALHAMTLLAKNQKDLLSVKSIAQTLDISANHLSKVMQRLVKAGFIESIKGQNGGFRLIVKPEETSFLEVYELFDGKLKDTICLLDRNNPCEKCILGDLMSDLNKQVKDKFKNTKLSDFIS